ncbi:hypothetical protein [Pontibacter cellulosilyticus]|uniref:Uncharacterized protein n=1 Tax=Pontibacter cellulosilyticus TaxID=1720253 RepID=A0A923NAU8_9BACT|nr:hypothetical protein [Pontibacter cellulosilyticus]MBC5994829.1 hypothetical protein [Pontibacter cellulosilyticus]
MNAEFNLARLGLFIKRQLLLNINTILIAIAAVVGVLLIISGLTAYSNPNKVQNLVPLYLVVLFIGGYIFTSRIFGELHSPQKSYTFLTLPVSTAEKLLGTWLIVSPFFLITAIAGTFLLMYVSSLMAGQPAQLPSFTDTYFTRTIGAFWVTQTFFFLGAIAFRGNNFLKTLLALFLIAIVVGGYAVGLAYMLFGNKGNLGPSDVSGDFHKTAEFIFTDVVPFLFWYVLGPFLLVVSYFKLKERQV